MQSAYRTRMHHACTSYIHVHVDNTAHQNARLFTQISKKTSAKFREMWAYHLRFTDEYTFWVSYVTATSNIQNCNETKFNSTVKWRKLVTPRAQHLQVVQTGQSVKGIVRNFDDVIRSEIQRRQLTEILKLMLVQEAEIVATQVSVECMRKHTFFFHLQHIASIFVIHVCVRTYVVHVHVFHGASITGFYYCWIVRQRRRNVQAPKLTDLISFRLEMCRLRLRWCCWTTNIWHKKHGSIINVHVYTTCIMIDLREPSKSWTKKNQLYSLYLRHNTV